MTIHTGLTLPGDITSQPFTFGNDAGLFLEGAAIVTADNTTATATGGNISDNVIKFGNGDDDSVLVGRADATATATSANATATANESGSITDNQITFGNGIGDHVQVLASISATSTASGGFTATANPTSDAGDISGNTIKFGNGDGDYVEVGGQIAITASATVTGGKAANTNVTLTDNGAGIWRCPEFC
jgi:hypothetical protein